MRVLDWETGPKVRWTEYHGPRDGSQIDCLTGEPLKHETFAMWRRLRDGSIQYRTGTELEWIDQLYWMSAP